MRMEMDLPPSPEEQHKLFGQQDIHLRMLRKAFSVRITSREGRLIVEGDADNVEPAMIVIHRAIDALGSENASVEQIVQLAIERHAPGADGVLHTERLQLRPRTKGQETYIQAVRGHALTLVIGPAGTGKTYLAVAAAVEALRRSEVERLILTRPAVEAGENLGFLPGDMREKVDPYLRPIYDALGEMLSRRQLAYYLETGVIEVAPLAFMRGRTLNRAFVILDEAQNTTPVQMKMFLTRLGAHTRAVVTGDLTQIDLRGTGASGLLHASSILRSIPDVAVIHLERGDIVRHPLVAAIVKAYEADAGEV